MDPCKDQGMISVLDILILCYHFVIRKTLKFFSNFTHVLTINILKEGPKYLPCC